MSVIDAHEAAPGDVADARLTARVTTTVVLPPDALTLVAPAPAMISQVTVEATLGIPPRVYLELLREPGCRLNVKVYPVRKLRVVDLQEFRRWLGVRGKAKRAAEKGAEAASRSSAGDEGELMTAEEQERLGIRIRPSTAVERR